MRWRVVCVCGGGGGGHTQEWPRHSFPCSSSQKLPLPLPVWRTTPPISCPRPLFLLPCCLLTLLSPGPAISGLFTVRGKGDSVSCLHPRIFLEPPVCSLLLLLFLLWSMLTGCACEEVEWKCPENNGYQPPYNPTLYLLFVFIGLSFDIWFNRCPPPTSSCPPGTSKCNLLWEIVSLEK